MKEIPFQYAILRYVHDPLTEEFMNIGIVMYSKEARYLKSIVATKYSRLSSAFCTINGENYRRMVGYIERKIAMISSRLNQLDLFKELPENIGLILREALPVDDSSLVFGGHGGGLSSDLELELRRLFARLVEKYIESEERSSRTDQDVWQVYRKELDKLDVTSHLTAVTIDSPRFQYEFAHAWKNDRWHPIEPVSFDLMQANTILDKANRWIGRTMALADSKEIGKIHFLVGAPQDPKLSHAYQQATRNMREIISGDLVEIVEEDNALEFSGKLAKAIKEHRSFN